MKAGWRMRKLGLMKQTLRMSWKNIIGNRMRSFLTTLGIIIGVTAVIALVTTVSGVTGYMMDAFSSMGAGKLSVTANGTYLKQGLSESDLAALAALDNVEAIAPTVSVKTNVICGHDVYDTISVTGKNAAYFQKNDIVTSGRGLRQTDMAGDVYVCVVDDTAAQTLFPDGDPLGKTVRIGGSSYTIVGLAGEDGNLMNAMQGGGSDGSIYIPFQNALSLNGKSSVTSLEVYIADTTKTDKLVDEMETLLSNAFNGTDSAYSILNMESMLDTMSTLEDMMTYMLAGIASIALLVGGISIMNMMLVSVTERTKEIGLRKALGAEPQLIQLQFLTESIVLSVAGGVIGILLGELLSYIASLLIGTTFAVEWSAVGLGFGFALAIGILFGWAPARRASMLNPIDALRSE